ISILEDVIANQPMADMVGSNAPVLSEDEKSEIEAIIAQVFGEITEAQRNRISLVLSDALSRTDVSEYRTGIVIAGFGEDEMFPSLSSFEVSGVIGGVLKYREEDPVDIDR